MPSDSYSDFKRFWALVRLVRDQIRLGFVSDTAKNDARELFQIAARELQRKAQKEHAHV